MSRIYLHRAWKRFVKLAKQDPGRAGQKCVKQEQEEISPNHVQAFSGPSVKFLVTFSDLIVKKRAR